MSKTLAQDESKRIIRQAWKRRSLQTYVFISRLKNDIKFREEWIKRRVQKQDIKDPNSEKKLLYDFFEVLELASTVNIYSKPVIRLLPKRFYGRSCQSLLDIDLKHLTTCVSLLVDDAAQNIIHGYGIVNVLGSTFGNEYKKMVTQYIIKRLNEDIKNEKQ